MRLYVIILSAALLTACSSGDEAAQTPVAVKKTTAETAACCPDPVAANNAEPQTAQSAEASVAQVSLPRLVDLGATTCKPCIMMEPVLESLREHYAGKMAVEFIDVRVNPEAARPYNISSIPTQIYFDANGTERWRHVGYISEEDLLAALTNADITLPTPSVQ